MKKLGIAVLITFLGLCPASSKAQYSIRYLGQVLSDDEQLIDASKNGWILVKDNYDRSECVVRTKLGSNVKIRLCDKGLENARKVNEKGVVLGMAADGKRIAVWGDRDGLKVLKEPKADYDSLTPMDINNKGVVVGFSQKDTLDEGGYIESSIYQAYKWRKDGTISEIRLPRPRNTQAVAINDKGETLLYSETTRDGFINSAALLLGKKTFKRIERRGQGTDPTPYATYSMNNRGQIATSLGRVFSPRTGWRRVPGAQECSRCDYRSESAISNSGKALFTYGWDTYLSAYPKPAIKLACLMPQNRIITNTGVTVQDLHPMDYSARFLNEDAMIFSANADGDNASSQLFVLERKGSSDAIRDYCPVIRIEAIANVPYDCSNSNEEFGRIETCKARFTVTSADGPLQGVTVKLYAQQSTLDASCPLQLVDTFTSSASGSNYSIRTDPGFSYYLVISDPKFGRETFDYSNLVREGFPVNSPISPCRKPFEGLVNNG